MSGGAVGRLFPGIEVIDVHAHLGYWGYPGSDGSLDGLRGLLDRSGFSKVIVSSALAIRYDVPEGNAAVARAAESDERIFGSVVFNAHYPEESGEQIRRYADHPRFVSAKIHPGYTGLTVNDPKNLAMIELLAERDLPLTFHSWSGDGPAAADVSGRFPKLTVIWFHALAGDYRRAAELAGGLPNVYLDFVTSTQERGKAEELVRLLGSRRLLFGTDQSLFDPVRPLGPVLEAGIGEEDRRRILGGNALELFEFDRG
jgi:predicted TIM-barrel fold metal-dependent hydrolase